MAAPLNPTELKEILAQAQQIPDPVEKKAFVDAALARIVSNVAEWRARNNKPPMGGGGGSQLNPTELKEILAQAQQIPDPVERKAFVDAALARVMKNLDEWRAAHPDKGWVGKLGGALGKGFSVVGNVVKKGIAFGVNLVGNAALLPLTPFIPTMRKQVSENGHKPKNDILGLAKQFREVVLSKKGYDMHYDNGKFNYDRYQKNYLDPISVGSLVSLIMGYFDKLKGKKAAGEPLTPAETKILETVEKAEEQIEQGVTDKVDSTIGGFVREHKTPIILTGLGLTALTLYLIGRARANNKAA